MYTDVKMFFFKLCDAYVNLILFSVSQDIDVYNITKTDLRKEMIKSDLIFRENPNLIYINVHKYQYKFKKKKNHFYFLGKMLR